MGRATDVQPDFGTNPKELPTYIAGFIICIVLTVLAFAAVMHPILERWQIFTIIYSAACLQFLVQLLCFLRLQVHTEQGKNNVIALVFTGVVLLTIVAGSLWIMWNVNYNMMFM